MTNINEVMDRLSATVLKCAPEEIEECGDWRWDLSKLSDAHASDLKALLSYTKQCREALERIGGGMRHVRAPHRLTEAGKEARQALSIQTGERE